MEEFTGERVIPGQVNQDLWNEHLARYLFAARLCRRRRVLDLACGTGYGTAELARTAAMAIGLDRSWEAITYARTAFPLPNARFLVSSCDQAPFPDASFDLITAFEVIEHLDDWRALLAECRRLLAPGGQFLVSTPNKAYYAESRRLSGANPYHVHEFEFAEFRDALSEVFPHVSLFVQNHAGAVVLRPLKAGTAAEVRLGSGPVEPDTANFFMAACATSAQTGAPTFVYLPTAANLLREREHHIAMLEREMAQKEAWLQQAQQDHEELLERHCGQTAELEASNRWADELNLQLAAQSGRICQLQEELAAEQSAAREVVAAYDAKIAELEQDAQARTEWALEAQQKLGDEIAAKARCVELLHEAEKTVEERTLWAQSLDRERQDLEARLNVVLSMLQASRWHRMGRKLGLGPQIGDS